MAKRKVALGKAIRWSEREIDEFAIITADDIDKMRLAWQRFVSRRFRGLIDAQEDNSTADDITTG